MKQVPLWFGPAVARLFALYPTAQMGKLTISSWWEYLEDLPEGALIDAIKEAPRLSRDFPPSAQAIREMAQKKVKDRPVAIDHRLTEGALTPEDIENNKKRIAEIVEGIGK